MSFNYFHSMTAYKNMDPNVRSPLYVLLANTADSSIRPIHYSSWPVAAGQLYEVMGIACKMAADAFNGNLHWGDTWGQIGISSKFLVYAERVLKQAPELAGPIPDLAEYPVFTFKEEDPDAKLLKRFAGLDRFEMRDYWDRKQIVVHSPTVNDIYWAKELQEHFRICKDYAVKKSEIDPAEMKRRLQEWSTLLPECYRELLQTEAA